MGKGQTFQVMGYSDSPTQNIGRQRFIALGLLPGVRFKLVEVAPLGDPFIIDIAGALLSVSRFELGCLQIAAL